jgi:hypothetical protein
VAEVLTLQDRLALHELAARYGNVIDDRAWDRLSTVFAGDATFETIGFPDSRRTVGIPAIRAMLEQSRHPVSHHVTNVEVHDQGDDVELFFKVIGPGPRGRVGSAEYRDIVRKESDGWRIVTHRVTLRRLPDAELAPPP